MRVGIIATIVGVALLLTSLSFAWFTAGGDADPGDIEVGSIRASLTIEALDPTGTVVIMGPGYDITGQKAVFQSTGSLDTLTRFKSFCNVTITCDANGVPLAPSAYYPAPAGENYVTIAIMPAGWTNPDDPTDFYEPLGTWIDAAGNAYIWGLGTDGNTYLLSNGAKELYFAIQIIIADDTPNKYMDAIVECGFSFLAGQALPDRAVPATFGIALTDIDFDAWTGFVMPLTRAANPLAAAWDKINAMPASAAKDVFAAALS